MSKCPMCGSNKKSSTDICNVCVWEYIRRHPKENIIEIARQFNASTGEILTIIKTPIRKELLEEKEVLDDEMKRFIIDTYLDKPDKSITDLANEFGLSESDIGQIFVDAKIQPPSGYIPVAKLIGTGYNKCETCGEPLSREGATCHNCVVNLLSNGEKYEDVANKFKIGVSRVRQIAYEEGVKEKKKSKKSIKGFGVSVPIERIPYFGVSLSPLFAGVQLYHASFEGEDLGNRTNSVDAAIDYDRRAYREGKSINFGQFISYYNSGQPVPEELIEQYSLKENVEEIENPAVGSDYMEIPVGKKGLVTIVDSEDYDRLSQYSWYISKNYDKTYATRDAGDGKREYMHRVIMNPPEGYIVKHRNGNGLDNRKSNLLVTTTSSMMQSLERPESRITLPMSSKYKGVTWDDQHNNYRSRITSGGKLYDLGSFEDEIEAAKAYDEKAKELFGPEAKLNFEEFQLPIEKEVPFIEVGESEIASIDDMSIDKDIELEAEFDGITPKRKVGRPRKNTPSVKSFAEKEEPNFYEFEGDY